MNRKLRRFTLLPGGNSAYESGGDALRLVSRILVSFRVFWAKRHHI